jgi:nicotinate-nucleotide adenylyltransferase
LQQIGLFCGTFNPIHCGHLLVAECARDQFFLEKVIFVTSARPPHRQDVFLASVERHAMVSAAVADNPFFVASTVEIERNGPSYTADTLKHFISLYGEGVCLSLLIGGDNVVSLRSWHRFEEIYQHCRLLIAPRYSENANSNNALSDLERIALKGANFELIDFPFVDISSSTIRRRIKANRSVLYMVPKVVNEIIEARRHYRDITSMAPGAEYDE